jgi:hypothetical protein
LVRLDNLKDPMPRHGEWLTGHVLSVVSIFEKDGAMTHYCSPVWTFNTEADRFLASRQSFKDKNNCIYYVSYPPMCFLLPHWIFTVCGTHSTLMGIRVINLAIHFLTAFFVYLLVLKLFNRKMRDCIFVPALFAFALYIFAAGNLWFHGHVFFADMIVPLFIVSFLYVLLRVLKGELSTGKACLLLFIPCALGSYTEWQMLFVAFFASIVLFIRGFRERRFFLYFLTVCAAVFLPLFITYVQYSSIAGSKELMTFVADKYKLRSGADSQTAEGGMSMDNSFSLQNISEHYERNYSTLLDYGWYALLLFLFLALINRLLEKRAITFQHFLIFAILLASIFLHHFAFFNFTAVHDFSTLKSALFLCLLCGYVLGLLFVIFDLDTKKVQRNRVIVLTLVAFGLFYHFSVKSYYKENKSSTIDQNHMVIGEIVRKQVKPNEVVFSISPVSPVTNWYAQRNLLTCYTCVDAAATLDYHHCKLNGQVVKLNAFDYEVFRINPKGDTIGHVKDVYSNLECLKTFKR